MAWSDMRFAYDERETMLYALSLVWGAIRSMRANLHSSTKAAFIVLNDGRCLLNAAP
jgi:hypothetical protein